MPVLAVQMGALGTGERVCAPPVAMGMMPIGGRR
jgi:hypothetical protein